MDIIVGGHICLDIIPRWEKGGIDSIIPGHILEMDGIKFSTGGAVANTGVSLKKLGIATGLLGKIGEDEIGTLIKQVLNGVDKNLAETMIVKPGETSSYSVVLNPPDADRIFLHFPGTNDTFASDDISYDELREAEIFHFGYPQLMEQMYRDEGEELVKIFKQVKEEGLVTSLDMAMPDPQSTSGKVDWKQIMEKVLPYVDIFVPSIDEMLYMLDRKLYEKSLEEEVVDEDLLDRLGKQLLSMGSSILGIKLGENGLYLHTGIKDDFSSDLENLINITAWTEKKLIAPCYSAEVAGTTGSGDAAYAGFLAGMLEGNSPGKAMNLAAGVGAFSVEAVDATGGVKSLDRVKERIEAGWERLPLAFSLTDWEYDKNTGIYSQ